MNLSKSCDLENQSSIRLIYLSLEGSSNDDLGHSRRMEDLPTEEDLFRDFLRSFQMNEESPQWLLEQINNNSFIN